MENLLLEFIFGSIIGLSLGLLGGGGSILAVPVLTYIFHLPGKESIFMSMGIVGLSGMTGSIQEWRQKHLDHKILLTFGPLSILGTFMGTKLAQIVSAEFQLFLFSLFTIAASINMLFGKKAKEDKSTPPHLMGLGILGVLVGIVTGLIGVGGGFLIVPALVIFAKLDFSKAVGTSLVLITINSTAGFLMRFFTENLSWDVFLPFLFFTAIAVLVGKILAKKIPAEYLKKAFGILLIVVGGLVLYKNHQVLGF